MLILHNNELHMALLYIYITYSSHIHSPSPSLVPCCSYWFSSPSDGFWFGLAFVCFCDPVSVVRAPYRSMGTLPVMTPLKKMSLPPQQPPTTHESFGTDGALQTPPWSGTMVHGLSLVQVLCSADKRCELIPYWRQCSTNHSAPLVRTYFLPFYPWRCSLYSREIAFQPACLQDPTTCIVVVSTRRSRFWEDCLPVASMVVYPMRCWETEMPLTPTVGRSYSTVSQVEEVKLWT